MESRSVFSVPPRIGTRNMNNASRPKHSRPMRANASSGGCGKKKSDFTVRGVTGTNVFKLSEAKGKFVARHFLLKTECPYCIRHTHDYVKKSADVFRG